VFTYCILTFSCKQVLEFSLDKILHLHSIFKNAGLLVVTGALHVLQRSVLGVSFSSVVWHHHLTHARSDKLAALQKRAVRIILYPLTLPYITALGYLKLESLKHCRTEADKKFFNSISQPDSCLHHLLPPPRDSQLVMRLRYANTYLVPFTKTKRFCSSINLGLANY